MEPQEGLVEDIKTMFIEQTLDTRIEAALPVLARLQQGKTMKEADIFENWANRLTEGTWQLPDTPETKQKLADLLVNELPVGPDATNALEQLDGVLGDDQLYDQLEALAQEDANADARDVIRARMEEMGLEVPGSEADAEVEPGAEPAPMEPEQGVTEGKEDLELYGLRVGDTVKANVNGKRVQGDVIDIFPETQQVELLLRGANAGRTITVDVQDTESMMEDSALDRIRNKLGSDGYIGTQDDRLRDQEIRRQDREQQAELWRKEREQNSQRSQAQSDAAADSMINWERNRQRADDDRRKQDADFAAYSLERRKRNDDDWERTFDMMRDRVNRYQYSTQRDVNPEQLAAISNIKYEPRRKKTDFVPVDETTDPNKFYQRPEVQFSTPQTPPKPAGQYVSPWLPKPDGQNSEPQKDKNGRTRSQWLKLVTKKFPDAIISQEKSPWGRTSAELKDGRRFVWTPVRPDAFSRPEPKMSEGSGDPYDFIKPGAMVKFGMWNKPQEHRTGRVVKMADGVVTVATDDGKNINLILANKSLSVYPVSADRQGVAEGSSCNMTLEGEYCPEHGLMECGMHEGAFHNPDQQPSPAAQAITRRILLQRTDLLSKYGPEKVGQAIDEVADFIGDVEEIGSSDVSGWVRHVEQMLGNMGDDVGEGVDDPINYNGAITGSYYEDKQDPLARIKSLALRK
jgi:hypothetical protein